MRVSNQRESAVVQEEVIEKFRELNSCLRAKWRFIILRLSDDEREIILSHCSDASIKLLESHKYLLSLLPDQNPAWILYNFPYCTEGGGKRNKIAIINWVPDSLIRETLKESARVKMHAVSETGNIKKAIKSFDCSIQANSPDDLSYENIFSKISKFERETIDLEASKLL